jgi:polyphenol oxidase
MPIEILRSELLQSTRHGFFTRRGGASSGIYNGLNCGTGSQDLAEAVRLNRSRVADALAVPRDRLLSMRQVHSAQVAVAAAGGWSDPPEADGAVTDQPGVALSVLTADCAPVLFHDPQAGVIGAAHAGWRGAIDGILEATLEAMEGLGAQVARVHVAVGPTLSQRHYEVGPEFMEHFADENPEFRQYFVNGPGDRYRFDLPGFVLGRLRSAGVAEAGWLGSCTYAEPDRFFSYRRSVHAGDVDYGRLISAIALA